MTHIVDKSERLIMRRTRVEDIEYVISAEHEEYNAQYAFFTKGTMNLWL